MAAKMSANPSELQKIKGSCPKEWKPSDLTLRISYSYDGDVITEMIKNTANNARANLTLRTQSRKKAAMVNTTREISNLTVM